MRIATVDIQKRSLLALNRTQEQINKAMQQVSTGKRLLSPGDDPVASSRIQLLRSSNQSLKSYQTNIANAENSLSIVEETLNNSYDVLSRIATLQKQAMNGSLTQEQREHLANECETHLNELMGLANSKDIDGSYLFSGSKTATTPFVTVSGNTIYQGDQNRRQVAVSESTNIHTSFSGFDAFSHFKAGNGTFVTTDGSVNNTGSGTISIGQVVDPSAYVADDYSIQFVTNGSGELAVQVTGTSSGQLIPALPATAPTDAPKYVPGQAIVFNGLSITLDGQPHAGDDFAITPSKTENIFTAIEQLVTALRLPAGNSNQQADFLNQMDRAASTLDTGMDKLLNQITELGSLMNTLDIEKDLNESNLVFNDKTLSSLEDTDPVEVLSRLNNQMTALQAAQMSYSKIMNLSLFNYL